MKKRFYLTKCKAAFTLAEVLITLAVIGIVAALTIGIFLPKIHSQIRAHQIAVAETKFTKAMEQMALNNAIGPYYETTQEFVDELQNYLKVSKVCDNDHLADCFGYNEIEMPDGEKYKIDNIKKGRVFGMPKSDISDFTGSTYAIQTLDGVSMILSWNTKCPTLEPGVYQWNGNTNASTSCVAALMDINGKGDKNIYNKDVVLFNAMQLGSACGLEFTVDGTSYCWGTPFVANETLPDCTSRKDELGIKNCGRSDDLWVGAVAKCGGTQNMPNSAQLAAFAKYLYGVNVTDNGDQTSTNRDFVTMNLDKLAKVAPILMDQINYFQKYYGSSSGYFYIWTGNELNSADSWYRYYGLNYTEYTHIGNVTNRWLQAWGVCIIE